MMLSLVVFTFFLGSQLYCKAVKAILLEREATRRGPGDEIAHGERGHMEEKQGAPADHQHQSPTHTKVFLPGKLSCQLKADTHRSQPWPTSCRAKELPFQPIEL